MKKTLINDKKIHSERTGAQYKDVFTKSFIILK